MDKACTLQAHDFAGVGLVQDDRRQIPCAVSVMMNAGGAIGSGALLARRNTSAVVVFLPMRIYPR